MEETDITSHGLGVSNNAGLNKVSESEKNQTHSLKSLTIRRWVLQLTMTLIIEQSLRLTRSMQWSRWPSQW